MKLLKFLRYIISALLLAGCFGSALYSPTDILTSHPALAEYCADIAHYAKSVNVLAVGAVYPEVSRFTLSVAWTIALPLFFLNFCTALAVIFDKESNGRKAVMNFLELRLISLGKVGMIFTFLCGSLLFLSALLDDLGLIHLIGLVSADGWHKGAAGSRGNEIFTSRFGLAWGALCLTWFAPLIYSAGVLIIPFLVFPKLFSLMRENPNKSTKS